MPAYVVVEVDVHDPLTYERYKELAPPSIAQYGGRYIARGGKTETVEGGWNPRRLVLLEFPSLDRAREWWSSPEYAEAKRLRHAASESRMVFLEGL